MNSELGNRHPQPRDEQPAVLSEADPLSIVDLQHSFDDLRPVPEIGKDVLLQELIAPDTYTANGEMVPLLEVALTRLAHQAVLAEDERAVLFAAVATNYADNRLTLPALIVLLKTEPALAIAATRAMLGSIPQNPDPDGQQTYAYSLEFAARFPPEVAAECVRTAFDTLYGIERPDSFPDEVTPPIVFGPANSRLYLLHALEHGAESFDSALGVVRESALEGAQPLSIDIKQAQRALEVGRELIAAGISPDVKMATAHALNAIGKADPQDRFAVGLALTNAYLDQVQLIGATVAQQFGAHIIATNPVIAAKIAEVQARQPDGLNGKIGL